MHAHELVNGVRPRLIGGNGTAFAEQFRGNHEQFAREEGVKGD